MMNKEKVVVDRGFELSYWRLSYRRKLIRTLWFVPCLIICVVILFLYVGISTEEIILYAFFATIVSIIQIIYNYRKWKHSMKNQEYIRKH